MGNAPGAVCREHDTIIRQLCDIGPEALHAPLRPLLQLDLHGLCEAYGRLAATASRCIAAQGAERSLGLAPQTARSLLAQRPEVPVTELLVTLVVASHTHALTKARFIFQVFDHAGQGRHDFAAFLAAVQALTHSLCCLSQASRSTWPRPVVIEAAAHELFAPGSPSITKEAFVSLVGSQGPVCKMLRRFARSAVDQHFVLVPWDRAAEELVEAEPAHSIFPRPAAGRDAGPPGLHSTPARRPATAREGRPSAKAASRAERGPGIALQLPASPGAGTPGPRRPGTAQSSKASAASPLRFQSLSAPSRQRPSSVGSASPSLQQPRGAQHAQQRRGTQHAQLVVSGVSGGEDLPKRKGYFQAVPSVAEAAMMDELEQVMRERHVMMKASATDGARSGVELEMKEDRLRSGIAGEIRDDEKRRDYRQRLDRLRLRSSGRLWTASREHVVRGGVLPPRCATPVTPKEVQQQVFARMPSPPDKAGNPEETESHPHSPPTLPVQRRRPSQLEPEEDSGTEPPAVPSEPSSSGYDEESLSEHNTEASRAEIKTRATVIRRGDVLLAFELFRTCYWFGQSRKPENLAMNALRQRNQELDEILAEAARDTGHQGVLQDCHSRALGLKAFLRIIWPTCTSGDMRIMLSWIERSRQKVRSVARPKPQATRESQAATLLELVWLFDAIDVERSGQVPLDSVEKFLCGELLTAKEREHLEEQNERNRSAARNPGDHVYFVDHLRDPRCAHFLYQEAEDRKEWTTFPSRARNFVSRSCGPTPHDGGGGYSPGSPLASLPQTMTCSGSTIASSSCGPSAGAGKVPQHVLCRVIGQHLERIARFLDRECGGGAGPGGAFEEREEGGGLECEAELMRVLDVASAPRLPVSVWELDPWPPPDAAGSTGSAGKPAQALRLPRLYWRYLVRCAMHQQLQDDEQPCHLEVHGGGKIDLVGFMCILAHDQLLSLFAKGQRHPTAEMIRRIAYAAH